MKLSILLLMMIITVLGCLAEESGSGKLDEFEHELNKPVEHNDDNDDDDHNDVDDGDDNFFTFLFRAFLYECFIGVPGEKEACDQFLWGYGFSDYPYSPGSFGAYDIYSTKASRMDLSTKYFYHDEDLDGSSIKGILYFTPFMNLEGSLIRFNETLPDSSDQMDIYDLYLNYVRFRSKYFVWSWGLGVKYLSREKNYTGFSLNTGWEIYFMKPWSIDLRLNNAFINDKLVNEINCNLKFYIYNFYIQAGYLREAVNSEAFQGFTAGIGVNF